MAATESSALGCPRCGGSLDFREGSRTTVCGACRTPFAITGAGGIIRYYLEEKLDLPAARTAARRFLATAGVDDAIVTRLRFEGGELCFLPFWRFRAHAVGWRWQERETTVEDEYVDAEGLTRRRQAKGPTGQEGEILALPVEYSSPACDIAPFGLTGIATVSSVLPLKGMVPERLARKGIVFDPATGAEQVRRQALGQRRTSSLGAGTVRQEERLELCNEQLALISYPVWRLDFLCGERLYPVIVDGVNGRLLRARFPGRARVRLVAPLATMTLLLFVVSCHVPAGITALLLFLGGLMYRGELSLAGVVRHFFLLVLPGEEVTRG